MPFGRLHEEAAGDSKLLALSDAAWRMWGMGLIYCQKNLTDGFIPAGAIFLWGIRAKHPHRIAEELCTPQVPGKEALWEHAADGYQVHDYLDWNDSKIEILKMRSDAKDRISRWRDRHRRDAEQNALSNDERNALQSELPNAHDVVRGSGSLESKERSRTHRTGNGVMAGALPRDHMRHEACGRVCLQQTQFQQFAGKYGGDTTVAEKAVRAWANKVLDDWAAEPLLSTPIGGTSFQFWDARWEEWHGRPKAANSEQRSTAPSADTTAEYLRKHRAGGQ
jgi:hypothetical protein